jgi:hypothetical protein
LIADESAFGNAQMILTPTDIVLCPRFVPKLKSTTVRTFARRLSLKMLAAINAVNAAALTRFSF